ncbi:MAG: cystathionine beta-lyase [Proteobacteria bacterium]|nr:MAG: cystathionine beta-lyase [Pseudomonadota bacterium]
MSKSWQTRLIHPDAHAPEGFRSLNVPVYRGSTVLFPNVAAATDQWNQYEAGYTYGLYGTATALELATRVCELEGGYRTILTPGGQGAISLINFALLKAGDHVLLPENIYGPNRKLAKDVLHRFGVEVGCYQPIIGSAIAEHIRDNTRLIWCESPGSITMELQDVPAIVSAAHARNVLVALDNTWSAGVLFDAFAHGVDVTMQALTKYVGGHSDLLLGSVTVRDKQLYERLGYTQQLLGFATSPDDCSLALRGMKTMAVRLSAIEQSALTIAHWLATRDEIELVLHPALPSCPGHESWKRDFTGSSGVFSFVFKPQFTKKQVQKFVDDLDLFDIGYSWGGVHSLAMSYDFQTHRRPAYGHRIVRLNIGLEATDDLQSDLEQSLSKM